MKYKKRNLKKQEETGEFTMFIKWKPKPRGPSNPSEKNTLALITIILSTSMFFTLVLLMLPPEVREPFAKFISALATFLSPLLSQ